MSISMATTFVRRAGLRVAVAGMPSLLLLVAACGSSGYGRAYGGVAQHETPAKLGAVATSGAGPTDAVGSTTSIQVEINNFAFTPATLTVAAGTTVTWTNRDSIAHTVTSVDKVFASAPLIPGAQFSHTFDTPGTYNYFCSIHPFMTATVAVQ